MDNTKRKQMIEAIGNEVLTYYKDTGMCLLCSGDDYFSTPHEDHCPLILFQEEIEKEWNENAN